MLKGKSVVVFVALCTVALVTTSAALAAKRPSTTTASSSLTLVVLDPDSGGANWGEQVTFRVATTATDKPYVQVGCYQGGTLVYSSSAGFFDGYAWPWTQIFTLKSSAWAGGAADCVAKLTYWDRRRFRTLTSLSFHVYP